MTRQADVTIEFATKILNATRDTKKFYSMNTKAAQDFEKAQNKMYTKTGKISKRAVKRMADANKRLNESTVGYSRALIAGRKAQEDFNKSMGKTPFAGWALSIMFAGMAMKRAFNSIWKSSSKTFQDVMHSVDGTVTGFDQMEGSLKFLQFTAGQALEPIAEAIIPIIDAVSDWISENEELFQVFVVGLGVGGTVLTAIGMGKLALNGFQDAFTKAFGTPVGKTKFVKSLGGLNGMITKAIGVVGIVVGLKMLDDSIEDFAKGKWITGGLKSAGGTLSIIGGVMMLKGNAVGGALIAIGVAMDLIGQGTFFTKIMETIGIFTSALMAGIEWLLQEAGNKLAGTKFGKILGMGTFETKSFVELYEDNLSSGMEAARQVDKLIQDSLDKAQGTVIYAGDIKIEGEGTEKVLNAIKAATGG
jgi:hypothetical protein